MTPRQRRFGRLSERSLGAPRKLRPPIANELSRLVFNILKGGHYGTIR